MKRFLSENTLLGQAFVINPDLTVEAAAKEAGVEGIDDLLVGPSALAFVDGDIVVAAKSLKTFAKENPALVIKGGYVDGKVISPEEVSKLAELESREVLLAKLAGAMNASLSQAVSLFAAPLSQAARTVDALRAKVEAEGPVAAAAPAADEAPAEEAPEQEAPAATDEAPEAAEAAAEAPAAEATDES